MNNHLSEDKHYNEDTSSPSPQKIAPFVGNYLIIRKIQTGGQARYLTSYAAYSSHSGRTTTSLSRSTVTLRLRLGPSGMRWQ